MKSLGWPDPIAADSGNGWHLLYHIDLPAIDDGLVQRCLESLAARFDDDLVKIDRTVFNPARIWKLYGTVAAKGDATPDRPHRLSRIVSTPGTIEVVTKKMMETLAGMVDKAPAAAASGGERRGNGQQFDLEAWIHGHGLAVDGPEPWTDNSGGSGKRWVFRVCPWNQQHTNESAFIVQRANGAISAGCRHNGCNGKDWYALRDVVEPAWRDRQAKQHVTVTAPRTPATAVTVHEYKPFPVDALPEPVRSFIHESAGAIGCDPCFVALPLLTGIASAVGNARCIMLRRGWYEPSIIWTAVVAESGDLKTPALHQALGPVMRWQEAAFHAYELAKEEYNRAMEEYEAQKRNARKSDGKSDEMPARPVKPRCRRFWCSDITVEALADRLQYEPRGLLVARDELSGWFASFDQYKNAKGADVSHYLTMHGARPLVVDRKTGDKTTIYVPRAAVSITGGIQPAILTGMLSRTHFENGLAARFLMAKPLRHQRHWTENVVSVELEQAISCMFAKLYGIEQGFDERGCPSPRILRMTSPAKDRWISFYNSHAEEHMELSGDMAAAWSKLESYPARLALLVHMIRCADADMLDAADEIDDWSIEAGIVLGQWFKHEISRIYAELSEPEDARKIRQLVEVIRRKGGRITARELQQATRTYRASSDKAEDALDQLVTARLGQWEPSPPGQGGGRPTRVFRLIVGSNGNTTSNSPENP